MTPQVSWRNYAAWKFNPNHDELGRFAEGQSAVEFVSPNVAENLNFGQALEQLSSTRQAAMREFSGKVDQKVGLTSVSHNAIGDWSDGAENTIFTEITKPTTYDEVQYSAAVKGYVMEQKAVIPFIVDRNGKDSLYEMPLQGKLPEIRQTLDNAGVKFRTLVPTEGGARVVVFDPGSEMRQTVSALAKSEGVNVKLYRGHGEFLGGDTREQGAAAYSHVISTFEQAHPTQVFRSPQFHGLPPTRIAASIHWRDWIVFKFNPNHAPAGSPEGGQFTSGDEGGGGDALYGPEPLLLSDHAANEAAAMSALNPEVTQVGGDAWNQQTAVRLEREYQSVVPALDTLAASLEGDSAETETEMETVTEEADPEEWDMVSSDDQQEAENDFIKSNMDGELDSQMEMWKEPGWKDQPSQAQQDMAGEIVGTTTAQTEFLKETLDDVEWDNKLTVTPESLVDAISLDYDEKDGLEISWDESRLVSSAPVDPNQTEMPFAADYQRESLLTDEFRKEAEDYITQEFNTKLEKLVDNADPPSWMEDQAKDSLSEYWSQMDDDQKFSYAKSNINFSPIETEVEREVGGTASGYIEIPSTWEPFNKGNDGYAETKAIANAMVDQRAVDIAKERGLQATPRAMDDIISNAWNGWKGSSTSAAGLAIQLAASQELGGRMSTHLDKTEQEIIDNYGGKTKFEALKAAMRAEWEVSQYVLDKSGTNTVNVYRGISLPAEALNKALPGAYDAYTNTRLLPNKTPIPNLTVMRNGAQSTTVDPDVANGWGSGQTRVVLRASVPRTAVFSLPVYGKNLANEQEVVLAGTAWKKWDAYLGSAPTFESAPLKRRRIAA